MDADRAQHRPPRPPRPDRLGLADHRRTEVDALPDVEALAVVLGGQAALARWRALKLLDRAGNVSSLARIGYGELARIVGERGARRFLCAVTMGRRAMTESSVSRFDDASSVHIWARDRLSFLEHEELWLLALDGRNGLRAARCVARGGAHSLSLRAKDVLTIALRENARAMILVHNHPSGDPSPSDADATFTREIAESAAIVGVPLLDHVVVARERFASVPFFLPGTPR